jgi:hypothetical protein
MIICDKCNKEVDEVISKGQYQDMDGLVFKVACHGQTDSVVFSGEEIQQHQTLARIEKHAFKHFRGGYHFIKYV